MPYIIHQIQIQQAKIMHSLSSYPPTKKQSSILLINLILLIVMCIYSIMSQKLTKLPINNNQLPGYRSPIYAGEIHYSRIPVEYWEHRILMIKAMGLNALSVYVMWNHHQISSNQFDYHTENRNLPLFLKLAQKHRMAVLIRPGPYVCAEWDFGGLPARLYSIPDLVIRSNNQQFLGQVQIYFQSLAPILRPYIRTKINPLGPIILLQIENEYGSYGQDTTYIKQLRKMWNSLNVKVQQYHEDGPTQAKKSHWPGAHVGVSGGTKDEDYQAVQNKQMGQVGFIFGGEIYTGWLNHWGKKWAKSTVQANVKQFQYLLSRNMSFSMYVAHGGTNFGLTAGANSDKSQSDYIPHITSYDYNAPITQQGVATAKYKSLRSLIEKYTKQPPIQIPSAIPTFQFPLTPLNPQYSILSHLDKFQKLTEKTELPIFQSTELQMFNQGIVIYETFLDANHNGYKLSAIIHDFAIVLINNQFVSIIDRTVKKQEQFQIQCKGHVAGTCKLTIIVQAMGHINYDHSMDTDFKGILSLTISYGEKRILTKWTITKIPISYQSISFPQYYYSSQQPKQQYQQQGQGQGQGQGLQEQQYPANIMQVYRASLSLGSREQIGDTYIDTSQLGKGYLFVNGRNLGRYWEKGPQKRLYCPGVWLKEGINQILILQVISKMDSRNMDIEIQGKTRLTDDNL